MEEQRYEIDFTKVKTIEDLCRILEGLDIVFTESYAKFDILKPFSKKKDE